MRCHTCGGETATVFNECQTCHTPLGSPPLYPAVPIYRMRTIGLAASLAVGATVVTDLLLSFFPLVGRFLAEDAARTGDADPLLPALLLEVGLGLLYGLAMVTAAILVIIWCYRARENLNAFPGARIDLGSGWAIAGWLVPFANFVVPYRVVANLTRSSVWQSRLLPVLVGIWWPAWLIYSLYGRFVSRQNEQEYMRLPDEPAGPVEFQLYVDYYGAALGRNLIPILAGVVAGPLLIIIIRRISAAQDERIARGQPSTATSTVLLPGMTVASPLGPGQPGGTIGA